MTITFYGALEYAILLLIVASCLYTSLALAISAREHIKEFRGNKEKISPNLWHDAQGDDLPPIDKEVIVLCDDGHGGYKVCYGHRPVESYTGISITNHSEMEEYYPERYGKGGWNIPDVKYWLDVKLPNLEEQK